MRPTKRKSQSSSKVKIFSYDVLKSKCTFKCNFCIAKICTLFNEFLNRLIAPNKSGYLKYCSNILDLNCRQKTGTRIRRLAHIPVFFSTYRFPASLKATIALKNARRTAQRKTATGSIPIIPQIKAFLLLRRRATMSGRI